MQWLTPRPMTIATVDIVKLIQDFIKKEQQKNTSEDVLKKEITAFGKALEKNIRAFSENHHVVLLPKEAVMGGSKDYTQLILRAMERSNEDNAA